MPLAGGANLGMVCSHVLYQKQTNLLAMLCLFPNKNKLAFSRMEPEKRVSLGVKLGVTIVCRVEVAQLLGQ